VGEDYQENCSTKQLKHKAKYSHQDQYNQYKEEFYIVPNEHPKYLTGRVLRRFSQHIKSTSSYYAQYPFLDYKWKLNRSIRNLNSIIGKIERKRSHLRTRQIKLKKDRELTFYEQRSYEKEYEQISDELLHNKRKLQSLRSRLNRLESTVLTLDGYREDLREKKEKERIERLEREIRDLRLELNRAEERASRERLRRRLRSLEDEKTSFKVSAWVEL